MKSLRYFFWATDVGMLTYWIITFLKIIPDEYLFKDYHNPILMDWNWSFFPLDLLIPLTGFYSLYLFRQNNAKWRNFALMSLILTSCSGLQAIVFWVLRNDYDPNWWIPNLYLLIYPLFFIRKLL